jgi:ribosome-binding factor A
LLYFPLLFYSSLHLSHCKLQKAHPRRIAKVSKQIEREIGNLFTSDRIIQEAICPEKKRGLDGAISALASITEVALSRDLQVAKVYISIYSDEAGRAAAAAGLQRLEGYVRRHVGNTVRLRLTPEIRLIVDDSIERSERMYKLLERARAIEAGEIEPPPIALPGDDYVDDEEYEGGEVGEEEDGQTIVDLGFFDDDEMVV